MQGNKKHTEGLSDSSSIGSLLDDTDREVCSLTDRAFKSLCVAELEASDNKLDLVISPEMAHQFSGKFPQGTLNHSIRKSNISNKLALKNNEQTWAPTFQRLPKLVVREETKVAKNSTPERKKPNLPASGPRNNKPLSKVSGLIKTFDKAENHGPDGSLASVKHPVKNSSQTCTLLRGNDMAFWDDPAILNIRKELSAFSDVCRDNRWLPDKHELQKRHHKVAFCGPDGYHPALMEASDVFKSNLTSSSKKTLKNRRGKAKKGNFLHSENSAFESWNSHHNKLSEKGDCADILPKKEAMTCFEETPLAKSSQTSERKSPPGKAVVARIQGKDFLMDLCPPTREFQDPLPPVPGPQVPVPLVPVHPVLGPPAAEFQLPLPSVPVPPVSDPPSPVSKVPTPPPLMSQVICTQNKAAEPELDYICPPWRRQRSRKGVTVKAQESSNEKSQLNGAEVSFSKKPSAAEPFADITAAEKQVNSPESSSPSFNITQLLTPSIPSKQVTENQAEPGTPPTADSAAAKGHEGSGFSDYRSRDTYKAKAPSLLFNLKDVRKRVKSTYSPSPLLKTLDEKKTTKENRKQGSVQPNATGSAFLENSSLEVAEKDELSHGPFPQADGIPEKDNKTGFEGHFTDTYLSLSSPQTTVDSSFRPNQDALQEDDSKNKDLLKDPERSENGSLSGHQSNEHGVGKSLHYPSLRGCRRDNAEAKAAQQLQRYDSNVQGHGSESQNGNEVPKIPPNLPSPAEGSVPYNENQTSVRSNHENKGKSSNSSSEYSFVSTVDQPFPEEPISLIQLFQRACLEESRRRRSEMNVDDDKRSSKGQGKMEGKDELQYYSIRNCDTSTEERSEGLTSKTREEGSGMNSATEGKKDTSTSKSEEPVSPLSFKPHLFQIKDNTFKSSPVIKAVKLPLLRSLSSEDTVATEKDKLLYRQLHGTPSIQEIDWSLSKSIKEQNAREDARIRNEEARDLGSAPAGMGFQSAEDAQLTWEPSFSEDAGSVSLRMLREDDKVTPPQFYEVGERNEESVHRSTDKAKRCFFAHQKAALGDGAAQSPAGSPSEEKTTYFKSHHLSNRRGGSCAKKIITREISSPARSSISENHVCCPATSDVSREIGHLEETPTERDGLAYTTVTRPRSDSSVVPSPLSERIAGSRVTKAEDVTNSASLNVGTKKHVDISPEEILDSTRRSLLSEDTGHSRMPNEGPQLLGRVAKPLGKPPAVPPKSEKALRRAKKLANKRKKMEGSSAPPLTERPQSVGRKPSHSGQSPSSPLTLIRSPPSPVPHSPFPPSESSPGRLQGPPSVSPAPSLPATRRKLLQDPDSGQYFLVDLPVQVHIKTFYEPETGKYIQVSIPSSERGLHQTASLENVSSPCISYPSVLPLPVPIMRAASQLSEPLSLTRKVPGAPAEAAEDRQQEGRCAESPEPPPYIEPVSDSLGRHADETEHGFRRDTSPSTNMDIVSISDLEDFAVEGIS